MTLLKLSFGTNPWPCQCSSPIYAVLYCIVCIARKFVEEREMKFLIASVECLAGLHEKAHE